MNFYKIIRKSLSLSLIVIIKVLIIYKNKDQNNILLNNKIKKQYKINLIEIL